MEEKYKGPEHRESVRLGQDIPVEYNFINEVKSVELSQMREGTIHNVSSGGVQLEVENLRDEWTNGLYSGLIKIGLKIKLPGEKQIIRALAKVIWLTKSWQETNRYIMGLEFLDITTADRDKITNYILNSYLEERRVE